MNPYEIQFGTNQFWSDLRARLLPILGDVDKVLSPYWMDAVEDAFGRADFWVLEASRKHPQGPDWYLVRLFPAAAPVMRDDWIAVSRSRDDAVALLASQCMEAGCWPDEAEYLEGQDSITIKLQGAPFAEIRPVPRSMCHDSAVRRRVESTTLGLRNQARSLQDEIVKRIAGWPGLERVALCNGPNSNQTFHLPDPSEWLLSARLLAEQASQSPLTTSEAQALAATVMGEPSWNHLCGHFTNWRRQHSLVSLVCPYSITTYNEAQEIEDIKVFYEFEEAYAEFANMAKESVSVPSEGTWTIYPTDTTHGLPMLYLVKPIKPVEKNGPRPEFGAWLENTVHTLAPVPVEYVDEVWAGRTRDVLKEDIARGVRDLLQIERATEKRHLLRSAEMGRELVAVDGGWYFTVDKSGGRTEHALFVGLRDSNGNLIFETAAPLYKGTLSWNERVAAYVLATDYDGRHPTGVIRGISELTAQKVQAMFLDRSSLVALRESDPAYRQRIDRIDKDMRQRIDQRSTAE